MKEKEKEELEKEEEEAPKKKSWKVDFILGIAAAVIGLPFFFADYEIVGGIMLVLGIFCIISGLCQRIGEKNNEVDGKDKAKK